MIFMKNTTDMLKTTADMIGEALVPLVMPTGMAMHRQQFMPCKDVATDFRMTRELAHLSMSHAVRTCPQS